MKSALAVVVALSTASFAAGKPVVSTDTDSANLAARTTDGISSCGDQWMAIDNVKTNNNAIERQGYNAAVDQFCAKAAGQNVGKDKFLSMAARVWLDYGGNPSTTGINGYVFFEVHNKKQSNGHAVNESNCKTYLKTLSATNSKCYGKSNHDTKGGTYQVGNEEVSYHALPKPFPPTTSSIDKTVLLDSEITPLGNGGKGNTLSPFPTSSFADITPFPCHSHNDYERPAALYTALSAGCIGVEADVWVHPSSTLTIAHTSDPGPNAQTLTDLYLTPLKALLDANNGAIFPSHPSQGIYLLVDFKSSDASTTWSALVDNLAPLRNAGYLSHYSPSSSSFIQRPVTIIASGNARLAISSSTPSPLPASLSASTNPDFAIFVDAVLDRDLRNFNKSNSFYASAKFPARGGVELGEDVKARMGEAKGKGLVVRYWDVPDGREKWQRLVQQGVDRLDVDGLEGIAGVDFGV